MNCRTLILFTVFLLGNVGALRGSEVSPRYTVVEAATKTPVNVATSTAPAGVPALVISQKGKVFTPAMVTIRVHRFITINNDDDTIHHVYCSVKDEKFNSGPIHTGESISLMFHHVGLFEVRCAFHPDMLLRVLVQDAEK